MQVSFKVTEKPLEIGRTIRFSIDDNVNISSATSITLHTHSPKDRQSRLVSINNANLLVVNFVFKEVKQLKSTSH